MLALSLASPCVVEHHTIPVINISTFSTGGDAERSRLGALWDTAMSSAGFAVITGHGVPLEVINKLYDAASQFFAYEHEQKMESCLNVGYGAGGYVPLGVEAVARSRPEGADSPADIVENLVFSYGGDPEREAVMPATPESLQPAVAAYWKHMLMTLDALMELSAVALHLPADYFKDDFRDPKNNLRLAHYPALMAHDAARSSGALRYGAHTDYTGFTILRQDPAANGLQAQMADGEWVGVPALADGLVINAGDLIQVWTNDRWRSPPHRVLNPPVGSAAPARLSLVFFTGPADGTTIEALPTCVDSETNPAKYAPISAREHLLGKLRASNTDTKQ
ncbi:hypothetical protein AB1Y20_010630 [Prymnesium parvum]|uniref:Fe2OG dioxygenase domain-containing protein n=1 Tax=Prymnesium parvum TaxID=97485 RepID=A0AB34IS33_PRYPA